MSETETQILFRLIKNDIYAFWPRAPEANVAKCKLLDAILEYGNACRYETVSSYLDHNSDNNGRLNNPESQI